MTVAPLLEQLHRDADAQVARRLDEARAQAASIAAELEARLERARADRLDAARREVERDTERELGAATQRASQVRLAARERVTNRVLEAAKERAQARAGQPDVVAWVRRNLDAALPCFPPGGLVVRCPPALVAVLRSAGAPDGRYLDVKPDDALSLGIVLESADNRLRVDATLESLLRAERPRLAIRLMRLVDGAAP